MIWIRPVRTVIRTPMAMIRTISGIPHTQSFTVLKKLFNASICFPPENKNEYKKVTGQWVGDFKQQMKSGTIKISCYLRPFA